MLWITRRLAEPSTRIGLGILAGLASAVAAHPPVNRSDWFALAFGILGGAAGVATPAPGSPDATPTP